MEQEIKICEECKSEYFASQSPMENLCRECSHILYGYPNCNHIFENNSCTKCGWNGNTSEFIEKLMRKTSNKTV